MSFVYQRGAKGSVMIFAVLLMSAGVFVLAAVLQLAATQGISGETEWDAVQRRVTLGNSRSISRQYMMSRVFRGSVPASTNLASVNFTNAYGGFGISPAGSAKTNYWAALSTTNTDVVLNINPFNLMERGGFYRETFSALLRDGSTNVAWSFALRTRSPVAAGYSFVQHRPAENDLASLATPPYIDFKGTGEQFLGFSGLPRTPVSSVTNTMTRVAGDTNGYQGYLDAPEGASVYGLFTNWVYQPREPTNQTPQTLQMVADLSATDPNVANSVLRLDIDRNTAAYTNGTNVYNLPIKAVVLKGTDIYGQKPLHVVVPKGITNLTDLVLSNANTQRFVYFYREKATNDAARFTVSSINASRWRLGITMSQSDIYFSTPGLTIDGGIRTDGAIGGSAMPTFVPVTDPGGLDFIADRMMWLEDYRAQQ